MFPAYGVPMTSSKQGKRRADRQNDTVAQTIPTAFPVCPIKKHIIADRNINRRILLQYN